MTRVSKSSDCGNSPKNKFTEDIAIAIEKGDARFLMTVLAEDFSWLCGSECLNEQEDVQVRLDDRSSSKPGSLVVENVLSHGKKGAVNGVSKFKRRCPDSLLPHD